MKAAPPFAPTSVGKRHTLPSPTALPAAASKTPIFDENDFIMRQKYKKNAYAITVQANF